MSPLPGLHNTSTSLTGNNSTVDILQLGLNRNSNHSNLNAPNGAVPLNVSSSVPTLKYGPSSMTTSAINGFPNPNNSMYSSINNHVNMVEPYK